MDNRERNRTTAARLQLQQQPIRHDFHAGIPVERRQRLIHRDERLLAPGAAVGFRQALDRSRQIRIRKRGRIGARREQFRVAKQRAHRPEVNRELIAIAAHCTERENAARKVERTMHKVAAQIRVFFRKRQNDRIVQFDLAAFYTLRDGRITEIREILDSFDLVQQVLERDVTAVLTGKPGEI